MPPLSPTGISVRPAPRHACALGACNFTPHLCPVGTLCHITHVPCAHRCQTVPVLCGKRFMPSSPCPGGSTLPCSRKCTTCSMSTGAILRRL